MLFYLNQKITTSLSFINKKLYVEEDEEEEEKIIKIKLKMTNYTLKHSTKITIKIKYTAKLNGFLNIIKKKYQRFL